MFKRARVQLVHTKQKRERNYGGNRGERNRILVTVPSYFAILSTRFSDQLPHAIKRARDEYTKGKTGKKEREKEREGKGCAEEEGVEERTRNWKSQADAKAKCRASEKQLSGLNAAGLPCRTFSYPDLIYSPPGRRQGRVWAHRDA